MPAKPEPIHVGKLRAYPKQPPGPRARGWYWQVVVHEDDTQKTAQGLSGRYESEEAVWKRLSAEVAEHGLDVPLRTEETPGAASFGEVLRLWLADQQPRVARRRLAQSSYDVYYRRCERWKAMLGAASDPEGVPARVQAALDSCDASPRTVRSLAVVLRAAWRFALQKKYVTTPLPTLETPRVDDDEHVYDHHTPDPADAVRVAARLPQPWQRLAADLLYDSGARISELGSTRPGDVDLVRGQLTIRRKGGKLARLPLSPAMTARLEAWIKALPSGSETLLGVAAGTARVDLRVALIDTAKRLKITPYTPHGIRRLVSWRLIEAHTNRRTYQEIMGHTYEMGLRTYARASEESRRAVIEVLSQRPALYDSPVGSEEDEE